MEWLVIYMFVMIEKVGALLALGWAAFWMGLLVLGVSILGCVIHASDYKGSSFSDNMAQPYLKLIRKFCKWAIIFGCLFGSLSILVPSQRDMAIIAGTGITYKAVTSETGQRLGGKAIGLLEQKIDAALANEPDVKPAAKAPVEGKAL